jgi:hypothetical protein
VDRQFRALRDRYRMIGIGFAPSRFDDVEFIPLERRAKSRLGKARAASRLLGRLYDSYYRDLTHVRDLVARLEGVRADVIIAHDIDTLPAVVENASGARILFDAHDFAPRQFEDRLYFRLFFQRYATRLCRAYIPRVDAMITVCGSLADAFEAETGVRAELVTNAPDYMALKPRFRRQGERIRLVHHGAAIRSRRIEGMVHAMDHLDDRFELDLYLVENSPGYLSELTQLAERRPNVTVRPPVAMPDLPAVLNDYDVGVFLLEPVNFNYRFALPNKLYEYVQARIAVAVSPSPEMAHLVRTHGCGVVAEDFSSAAFAEVLARLDHDAINEFKRRSHEAAQVLSSEPNMSRLREMVDRLVGRP